MKVNFSNHSFGLIFSAALVLWQSLSNNLTAAAADSMPLLETPPVQKAAIAIPILELNYKGEKSNKETLIDRFLQTIDDFFGSYFYEFDVSSCDPLVNFISLCARIILVIVLVSAGGVYAWSSYKKKEDTKRFLTSTRLSLMDKEVQYACNFIEINYADRGLSPPSICESMVTSTAFLEALFEKELGMGVTEFITQVRINRAKQYIELQPDAVTYSIAAACGFADEETIRSHFKRIAGTTIEEYASQCRQKMTTSDGTSTPAN
ncbi:MAG: helix-turn-helix domain-containing protein [Chitinivibrionales bacterium]|nr:helix-turn-helix domain-containing protein [Chitinivibrionales bacterium]